MTTQRTFEDRPAVRESTPLLVGLMGPSGGGKTYSALRLATGIQQVRGGDIYFVDTEARRALAYADTFKFRHIEFKPPFGSLDYLEAVRYCRAKGASVVIVDSMTHEHIGEGGYLEEAEAVVDRLAGDDYRKREAVKMLGWAKVGPKRQRMIEGIKQAGGDMIFCFRAKEKVKPIKNADGKVEIVDLGYMPLAGDELLYEMTCNCLLLPRADGVPTWVSEMKGERAMMKLPRQFVDIFRESRPLCEEIGQELAKWSSGAPASPPARDLQTLCDIGDTKVREGIEALTVWGKSLSKEERKTLGAERIEKWKQSAANPAKP
jgi:hypothetical protein